MPLPFLTARWSNLCIFSYAVRPSLLLPYLPTGLELDTRDGHAFVSLVAFDFLDTRVFGVAWPGYRNFPELNLRFHVRCGADRGVVFVREFVPLRLVAWLARWLYNEPYRAAPMKRVIDDQPNRLSVEYRLAWGGRTHSIGATAAKPAIVPGEDSDEHFFKEHRWGFGTRRRRRTTRYEVRHAVWQVYPVTSYHVDLDWAAVCGPSWSVLQAEKPHSTVLALGSAVSVFPSGRPAPDPRVHVDVQR